ncbi:hypothetical protein ABK040_011131 [Willaertia magna]
MKQFNVLIFLLGIIISSYLLLLVLAEQQEQQQPSNDKTNFNFHVNSDAKETYVTFYQNQKAFVERIFGPIDLNNGQTDFDLEIKGLSPYIDEQSLSFNTKPIIIDTETSKSNDNKQTPTSSSSLYVLETLFSKTKHNSVTELTQKLDKLLDEERTYNAELQDLKHLKQVWLNTLSSIPTNSKDPLSFGTKVEESKTILSGLTKQIIEKENIHSKLLKDIDEVKEEINKIENPKVNLKNLKVKFQFITSKVSSKGATSNSQESANSFYISFKYVIDTNGGFRWDPIYTLDVNSAKQVGRLVYEADIIQSSGEDFTNAILSLSTASLTMAASMPEILPLTLDQLGIYLSGNRQYYKPSSQFSQVYPESQYLAKASYQAFASDSIEAGAAPTTGNIHQNALNSYLTYEISRKMTILSQHDSPNRLKTKVLIGFIQLDTMWYHKAVPKQSTNAYTKMNLKNKSNLQLIPGPLNVLVDHSLISQTSIDRDIFPEEMIELNTGIDPKVKIKVLDRSKTEDSEGWFKKTGKVRVTMKVQVENTKDVPINMTIIDALPKASAQDASKNVKVELSQPQFNGDETTDLSSLFQSLKKEVETEKKYFEKSTQTQMSIKRSNFTLKRQFELKAKEKRILLLDFVVSYDKE